MNAARDDARSASGTDRGVWRVVARREFWVRLRDRGFLISTSITMIVLSGFILVHRFASSGPPSFTLGESGEGSVRVGDVVKRLANQQGDLNQESQSLAERLTKQQRLAAGDQASLERLAAQQQMIRQGLEQAMNGAKPGDQLDRKSVV